MIGSIVLNADPVQRPDGYLLNLVPAGARGHALARFLDYSPTNRAEGGPWGVGFTVMGQPNVLKEIYEIGLGMHVEAWGFGLEPDFEGRVEEISFHRPPDQFSAILRTMANRGHMRADTDDDGIVDRSTTIENTASQDLYGIADIVMAGGELSSVNVADQTVQAHIDLRGLPKPSTRFGVGGDEMMVEIFAISYLRLLERRIYNQIAETGNLAMTSLVGEIIDSVGEYVGSQELDANTTSITREHDIDRRALDILFDSVRLGDSRSRRWLLDMVGRNSTGVIGRRLRLHQAAPVQPAGAS